MHVQRLTLLKEFLETADIADDDFSLAAWQCGTVACAVGWATTIPEFNRQGFRIKTVLGPGSVEDQIPILEAPDGEYFSTGWSAVRDFFQLNYGESHDLFMECSYPKNVTRFMVADRIGQLIDGTLELAYD